MTSFSVTVQLGEFDAAPAADLDPVVWSANLAALEECQPDLAADLRSVQLPANWRPALGLDGAPTYRLEEAGQPPVWLSGTAAPLARARGLLSSFQHSGKNVALPCAGSGAEIALLLERLPAFLALYVFEADRRVLAALLRIRDFSQAIAGGRCLLVPPGREADGLSALLDTYPGLLPPGEIVLPDLAPRARTNEVRLLCEQINRRIMRARSAELENMSNVSVRPPATAGNSPRLAVVSLNAQPASHRLAQALERAARRLGWPVSCQTLADPRHVHPLYHARVLTRFQPTLTVAVNHLLTRLPALPLGLSCVWFHDDNAVPASLSADDTLYLGASPRVLAALERSGARRTAACFWACDEVLAEEPLEPTDDRLVLLADLFDTRADIWGFGQSSHQMLWRRLREVIGEHWQTPRILDRRALLARAERVSGVEISDAGLRESLLRLIERVLIPATVAEEIARALSASGYNVLAVGHGWQRVELPRLVPYAVDIFQPQVSQLRPAAAVLAGQPDPLCPSLLRAAGLGWPLVVHRLGEGPLRSALGDVLRPEDHLVTFSSLTELRRVLRGLRDRPEETRRRAERACRHLAERHTYEQRLRGLASMVQGLGGLPQS